jgi:8-oxo-dGTP diphosphatase
LLYIDSGKLVFIKRVSHTTTMSVIATINPESLSPETVATFTVRQAARAVVFREDGRIALLHVKAHAYHKLPGGGIEPGEDIAAALVRECLEEIGCDIYIGESLGEVHEYRERFTQHQISYCFTARVAGVVGVPKFTEDEQADGFALEWYQPGEALMILTSQSPTDYVGQFVTFRDTAILQLAQ